MTCDNLTKDQLERELEEAKYDLENNLSEQEELRSIERSLRQYIAEVEERLDSVEEE
jgi:hypothetical protein